MFVLKKVFGEHITATKAPTQKQQTRFRIIAYNAYRKINFLPNKHFYTTLLP